MKRSLLVLGILILAVTALPADEMSVQVEKVDVRGRPSGLAPITGQLYYGDRIEVFTTQGPYVQVHTGNGTTGWVHGSALTKKEVVLSSGGQVSSGASSDEVALAGKGFNKEIEAEYKAQTDLDFSWVDTMEEWGLAETALVDFLEEGELEGVAE